MEQGLVVDADGEVLLVPHPAGARVEHVGVGLADLPHPARDRDADGVADVAAARVEGHDGLQLEPLGLHDPEQLPVRAPLVPPGPGALHDAPPHVHHDAVHAGAPQPPQLPPEPLRVLQLVLGAHHVQLPRAMCRVQCDAMRSIKQVQNHWLSSMERFGTAALVARAYWEHDVDRDVAGEHRLLIVVGEQWRRLPRTIMPADVSEQSCSCACMLSTI